MSRATNTTGADLVDQLFDAAFPDWRPARSAEYKAGVRAQLEVRVHGIDLIRPYPVGTAQADAFYAGVDEGHALWRKHKSAASTSSPTDADGA